MEQGPRLNHRSGDLGVVRQIVPRMMGLPNATGCVDSKVLITDLVKPLSSRRPQDNVFNRSHFSARGRL